MPPFFSVFEDADGFILNPQSLNPFLRVMETMGLSKRVVVIPAFETTDESGLSLNNPAYMIIKVGESGFVRSLEIE